jgi:bacterial/archaeal transporter family-2 protein
LGECIYSTAIATEYGDSIVSFFLKIIKMKHPEWYHLILLGLIVGAGITTQSGINATLKTALTSPVQAAFISFLVGTTLLGLIAFSQGERWFVTHSAGTLPWWVWVGGLLGAFNISMSIYLAPRLGALLLGVSIVTGQMIASIAFDHFGLLGFPKVAITPNRLIGSLLMLSGLILVTRK